MHKNLSDTFSLWLEDEMHVSTQDRNAPTQAASNNYRLERLLAVNVRLRLPSAIEIPPATVNGAEKWITWWRWGESVTRLARLSSLTRDPASAKFR